MTGTISFESNTPIIPSASNIKKPVTPPKNTPNLGVTTDPAVQASTADTLAGALGGLNQGPPPDYSDWSKNDSKPIQPTDPKPFAPQVPQNPPKQPTTIEQFQTIYRAMQNDYKNGNLTPDKMRDYANQYRNLVGKQGLSNLDQMALKRVSTHLDALALNQEAMTAFQKGDRATGFAKLQASNAKMYDLLNQYNQAVKIYNQSKKPRNT